VSPQGTQDFKWWNSRRKTQMVRCVTHHTNLQKALHNFILSYIFYGTCFKVISLTPERKDRPAPTSKKLTCFFIHFANIPSFELYPKSDENLQNAGKFAFTPVFIYLTTSIQILVKCPWIRAGLVLRYCLMLNSFCRVWSW